MSIGIVRKPDPEGRITIPIDIRKTLDIKQKDGLEIYIEDDKIILIKSDKKGTRR